MTDEQTIKALECCKDDDGCTDCPYYDEKDEHEQICVYRLHKDILDLIKRQQAEIEDLTERLKEYKSFPCFTNDTQVVTVSKKADGQYCADRVTTIQIDKIRSEAYKEFAERLKKVMVITHKDKSGYCQYETEDYYIDRLVKELTEEQNNV